MTERSISQTDLNKLLRYDSVAGVLFWKKRKSKAFNSQYAGNKAGCRHICKYGEYFRVKILGQDVLAHQIIWAMTYGEWPNEIDHENGDGTDNRLCNLRKVTRSGNQKNARKKSNNTSGIIGVFWYKRNNKWGVIIVSEGKRYFLGLYQNYFDACCTRKSAEIKYGFHKNHGRS